MDRSTPAVVVSASFWPISSHAVMSVLAGLAASMI
jgi:hypothetical protein